MRYRYRSDDELKDSGVEWIDKIPKDWERNKLKHELKFSVGATPSTSNKDFFEGENIWVTISDLKGKYCGESKTKITQEAIKSTNMKKVPCNSLLYSFKLSVGQVAFTTKELYTNEAIASFYPNEKYNLNFWYYALKTYLIENANENIYGAKLLNQDLINNANVFVPNKLEQEKIANFLDKKTSQFDLIISKKEELIKKLEEAKKSLISEVVTGKVKVVKTDDGYELVKRKRDEMKDSGVEWLGEIPKDWNIIKLKYIGEAITGLTYSSNDIVGENEGTLVLRSSNVQNGRIVLNDNVYVNMDIPKKLITREGDIIICSRNGSRALIGKNACIRRKDAGKSFGAFMTIFRSRYYEYLNFVFNSHIFKAQSGSFLTSTINQLTIGNLNSFIIALPNEKEQDIIVKYLCNKTLKYNSIIDKLKGQIEKLKEAKQSLISEAVTGKIEILD